MSILLKKLIQTRRQRSLSYNNNRNFRGCLYNAHVRGNYEVQVHIHRHQDTKIHT